ncbi:MAG: sulfite exporter TauE/SafE family protein [Clostridia bacterium]|nr:sulfite exporter TauE/SafE family protein [Clostridia bacterium]
MKWFLYALAGFCGGFVGGMGMGGGTLLIPLLTLLLGFSQKQAQAVNLVAFLPMAAVALVIHAKKRRVRFREAIWFLPSGVIVGTLGALIMRSFSGRVLRKSFGAFLVLLALVSVIRRLKTPPKRSPYAPPKRSSYAPPKRSSYSPRKAHRCAAQKDGETSAKQR